MITSMKQLEDAISTVKRLYASAEFKEDVIDAKERIRNYITNPWERNCVVMKEKRFD